MKIIGTPKKRSPLDYYKLQCKLIEDCKKQKPYLKPQGIILKFKTWAELDEFNRTRAAKQL